DVPLLAAHFAHKHASRDGTPLRLTPDAIEALSAYAWPGNVRELENFIERACVTARGGEIGVDDLPGLGAAPAGGGPVASDPRKPLRQLLGEVVASVEREYLVKALRKTRGHVGKAARLCGYSRRSITGKLAEYHIDRAEFAEP